MNRVLRAPLITVATLFAVGLGAMTMTARPAAALSDRDTMGVILGLGAAAVLLNQIDRDDRPRRHQPPPPPPRVERGWDRDWNRGWDRGPQHHGPARWDRGPDRPRHGQVMMPGRGPDFGPGFNSGRGRN